MTNTNKAESLHYGCLEERPCIAVVHLNDCDILGIDQLSRKRDQYGQQLITEAAMADTHNHIVGYKQMGRATFMPALTHTGKHRQWAFRHTNTHIDTHHRHTAQKRLDIDAH